MLGLREGGFAGGGGESGELANGAPGSAAGSRLGRREVVDGARRFANKQVLVETEDAAGE